MDNSKAAQEILGLIRQINVNIKHQMMSGAVSMGFSMTQFLIMHELTQSGSITMHDLQLKCALPKSTMSRSVDLLVKRGVLARIIPENNRRIVMLSATSLYTKEKAKLKQSVLVKISAKLNNKKSAVIKNALEELYKILKFEEKEEV